jgi:hypothetical protein
LQLAFIKLTNSAKIGYCTVVWDALVYSSLYSKEFGRIEKSTYIVDYQIIESISKDIFQFQFYFFNFPVDFNLPNYYEACGLRGAEEVDEAEDYEAPGSNPGQEL